MTCSGVSWWLWSLAQGQHVLLRLESDLSSGILQSHHCLSLPWKNGVESTSPYPKGVLRPDTASSG